jgi:hypothetical protein
MPDMPDPSSKAIIEQPPALFRRGSDAYPLDECYARDKRKLPSLEVIAGTKMLEPYKSLLVHNNDMTSTLEKFHGGRIHLDLLAHWRKGDAYFREVALVINGSEKRVEFGAIKINLALFDPKPRELILEECFPLGRILHDCQVAYHSNPKSFLKVQADDFIGGVLQLTGRPMLFARRNTLSTPKGEALAEIVEILPP